MPFTKLKITNTFIVIVTLIYELNFLDDLCYNTPQCKYWTWVQNPLIPGTDCFLKTSDYGKTKQIGAFSGPKGCSTGK